MVLRDSSYLSLQEKVPFNPGVRCEVSECQYVVAVSGNETADLYEPDFIFNFYFQFKVNQT